MRPEKTLTPSSPAAANAATGARAPHVVLFPHSAARLPAFFAAGLLLAPVSAVRAQGQLPPGADRPVVRVAGTRVAGYDQTGSARVSPLELRASPRLRLDDTLRAVPGFSLFRRGGSLLAQPTTQGVSLRGAAPSAAGRSLVLLDGLPQNDPFGGWIYWSRLPAGSVSYADLAPGPRPGPFGASAMAGTVSITRQNPPPAAGPGGSFSLAAGERGTFDSSLTASLSGSNPGDWAEIQAAHFQSDGFPLVAGEFRGPVDIPAWSDLRALDLRASKTLDGGLLFRPALGVFEERRGNGTPLTGSAARGADLSLTLEKPGLDPDEPLWRALLFAQTRHFRSSFSAVSPDRVSETPSLDQFGVPASALGLAFDAGAALPGRLRLRWGADGRLAEGETRERFRYLDGRFTAQRAAGGCQLLTGAFARATAESGPLTHTLGLRLDYWRNDDARRIERPLGAPSGFRSRNESAPDAHGLLPSARWDTAWRAAEPLTLSASAYLGGRAPALNELHRPFRVRDELTEANPALDPERLLGLELGADLRPASAWSVSSRLFYNQLLDGVANVTLGRGPFDSAVFGFIPPGVTLRQKQNLPRIDTAGLESALEWAPSAGFRLVARHLFTDSRVADAGGFRALEGRRPAQMPAHQAHLSLILTPASNWEITLQGRAASFQYDDDLNQRRLADFYAADLRAAWSPAPDTELFAACENLFDTEIENGKTSAGVVAITGPRLFRAGFTRRF